MKENRIPHHLTLYFKMFFLLLRAKEPVVEMYFKNKKVLDVGCGQGDFLAKDPEHFVGVDTNEELLARAHARGLHAVCASAAKLPFPDQSFEGAYCVNVIEHLPPSDARYMLQEIARVLAPGAPFLLGTEWPTRAIWDTFSHVRPYSPKSIKKLLSEDHQESFPTLASFRIESVFYKGFFVKNFLIRTILWVPAIFIPVFRRDWLMVLRKKTA